MQKPLLMSLLLGFLSSAAAQTGQVMTLPVLRQGPATPCVEKTKPQPHLPLVYTQERFYCYQDNSKSTSGAFISMKAAYQVAQNLGGTVRKRDKQTWEIWLGNSSFLVWPSFYLNKESYLEVSPYLAGMARLLSQSPKAGAEASLSGFYQPELRYGKQTIRLSRAVNYKTSKELYIYITDTFTSSLIYHNKPQEYETRFVNSLDGYPKIFQTHLAPNEMIMALSMLSKDVWNTEVEKVDKLGRITLHGPNTLHFVDQVSGLRPPHKGQPLPTLLIHLSNTPLQNPHSGIVKSRDIQAH